MACLEEAKNTHCFYTETYQRDPLPPPSPEVYDANRNQWSRHLAWLLLLVLRQHQLHTMLTNLTHQLHPLLRLMHLRMHLRRSMHRRPHLHQVGRHGQDRRLDKGL
eukprot:c31432_g1_i1 orf=1-315(-)